VTNFNTSCVLDVAHSQLTTSADEVNSIPVVISLVVLVNSDAVLNLFITKGVRFACNPIFDQFL
jgi:hypothetical protein